MSQLQCPSCGKYTPISNFDPSNFDDDIYAATFTGLGRGRGFAITSKYSVLDDSVITGLIADRCHRILGLISGESSLPVEEGNALRATLESWIIYARKLEEENKQLQVEVLETDDDYESDEDSSQRLLRKINKEVSFDFDSLEDAISFLLEN
jgi:hypothetical protein